MSLSDPIADMLTRVRNANTAQHESVDVPMSKQHIAIARIMKEEGFIKYYKLIRNNAQGTLRIFLKYGPRGERVIGGLDRVSKPGIRRYVRKDMIPRVRGGLGLTILSTSSGIMTGKEARRKHIGGEVICKIW